MLQNALIALVGVVAARASPGPNILDGPAGRSPPLLQIILTCKNSA